MVHLSACPLCQEKRLVKYLSPCDHTVSHETFNLDKCEHCGFVVTNPRPDNGDLSRYYQSDAYISHSDKSSTFVDHIYKISRHYTLKWKYDVIKKHSVSPPVSLLDFGCGTGAFLQECQKHHIAIAGIEPSERARAIATENAAGPIHASVSQLEGSFDTITLWHVLEHVPDLYESLRTLKGHLNPQGTMFIAVPNHLSADAEKYGAYWAGYDVPRHLWHFSRTTMENAVKQQGLTLINTVPMKLDAYYVSLLSEKYKRGNTSVISMVNALISGWKSNAHARTTGEYSSLIYILRK